MRNLEWRVTSADFEFASRMYSRDYQSTPPVRNCEYKLYSYRSKSHVESRWRHGRVIHRKTRLSIRVSNLRSGLLST